MAKKKTRLQIEKIVKDVQFGDESFVLLDKGDGYLLQLRYLEADIDIGEEVV